MVKKMEWSEIWQTPEEQLKIAAVTYGFKEVEEDGNK
jgi:hypothetical protein